MDFQNPFEVFNDVLPCLSLNKYPPQSLILCKILGSASASSSTELVNQTHIRLNRADRPQYIKADDMLLF